MVGGFGEFNGSERGGLKSIEDKDKKIKIILKNMFIFKRLIIYQVTNKNISKFMEVKLLPKKFNHMAIKLEIIDKVQNGPFTCKLNSSIKQLSDEKKKNKLK